MRYAAMGLCFGALLACSGNETDVDTMSASGELAPATISLIGLPDVSAAFSGSGMTVEERVSAIEEYVDAIESKLPGTDSAALGIGATGMLTRHETMLSRDAFADITDERWARMETFTEGSSLKRLKVHPLPGNTRTEEFYYTEYFTDDRVIFVYIEPKGSTKADVAGENEGDRYYFGEEGMIAWYRPDGSSVDPMSEEFRMQAAKLMKEAEGFPKKVK